MTVSQLVTATSIGPLLGLAIATVLVLVLLGLNLALFWYYRRRLAAAVGDSQSLADLAAQRDQLFSERDQLLGWMDQNREELLKKDAERQEQERLRLELANLQQDLATHEQRADAARRELLDVQHALTSLADDRDRVSAELASLSTALSQAKVQMEQLTIDRRAAEDALLSAQAAQRRIEESALEAERRLANLTQQAQADEARRAAIVHEVDGLTAKRSALLPEVLQLESRIVGLRAELESQQQRLTSARDELDRHARLTLEVTSLERQSEMLKSEILALKTEREESTSVVSAGVYSDLLETEPPHLSESLFRAGAGPSITEEEALERVSQHLRAQGLVFPRRVLDAFHTCLKINQISPITVLAGVSGTGKSELPIRYAEAMGMHSLAIAVQPSWSSPQDLFGFYNYLEKRYRATELARSLVRMDPYNFSGSDPAFRAVQRGSRKDRMLLVLLDEMNLARVEYYFSEFLSKLEIRRTINVLEDPSRRAAAEVEIEGARVARGDSQQASAGLRVWVGQNVLFVGTMNEDESTQTLSDKVLDRANVLRFGRPASGGRQTKLRSDQYRSSGFLQSDVWASWIRSTENDQRRRKEVSDWIERLNEALSLIGRPFGWRVKEAIHEYVTNYPGSDRSTRYRLAMADQIEQKVLPKLRGMDVSSPQATSALNQVESVLEELADDELSEAIRHCRNESLHGTFNWPGVTRADASGA